MRFIGNAPAPAETAGRTDRHNLYYVPFGLIAGIDVILFAYLSADSVWATGPMFVVAGFTGALIFRMTNANATAPQYRRMICWLLTVGVLFVGGLLLASGVAHQGGAVWLSWIIGAILFAVYCTGMYFVDGRPLPRTSGSS